jgi:hypothetical protein
MRRELAGYELDQEAFRRHWIRHLYGRHFRGTPNPADAAIADIGPELLGFLRLALDHGQDAEWLFVGIPA